MLVNRIDSDWAKKAHEFKQKRNYVPVEPKKKQKLIDLVFKRKMTIKDAAAQLLINYSTAKHIIKTKNIESKTSAGSSRQTEKEKSVSNIIDDNQK